MKILLIYPGKSGPLKVANAISTHLAKLGNQVYLYLLDSPEYKLDFGDVIVDFPPPHLTRSPFFGRLARMFKLWHINFYPDIILTSFSFPIPFMKLFFRNAPIVYNMMGVPRADVVINNITLKICYMLESLMSKRYSRKVPTFTTSKSCRKYTLKNWKTNVGVIWNGINTDFFRPTNDKTKLRKDLKMHDYDLVVILGLTRFTLVYKPMLYLKWYNNVLQQHNDKKILTLILGKINTSQKEAIHNLFSVHSSKNSSNSHQFIIRYITDLELLRNYYQVSDVFISFLPQSLMEKEALACGIPVLTAFWEGQMAKKLLHNLQHGLSQEIFIEKLNLLLSNEKLRNRYTKHSRLVAESDFSNEVMADRYFAILKKVVSPSINKEANA